MMLTEISRVVTYKDGRLFVREEGSIHFNIFWAIPRPPRGKYRVRYRIDPAGKFEAVRHPSILRGAIMTIQSYKGWLRGRRVPVCFLPLDWGGKRVSRRVERLEK